MTSPTLLLSQQEGYSLYFFENKVLSQQKDAYIASNQEWSILRDPDLSQASYVISDTTIVLCKQIQPHQMRL